MQLTDKWLPLLDIYLKGEVSAVCLNIGFGKMEPIRHVHLLSHFRRYLKAHPDRYILATGVDDIYRANEEGKLAVFFNIEGANGVGNELSLVPMYYDLGVRWMLLAYNRANLAGGGCHDETDPGLNEYGRKLLDEMTRVGMIVCCSHTGYRTVAEIIEYTNGPVIFSHSNPRSLWEHDRNIPDELIKACAASGGVVGINGINLFLGCDDPGVEDLFRHIDYVVELVGSAHVGIGLDYGFSEGATKTYLEKNFDIFPPDKGYEKPVRRFPPSSMPELSEFMKKRGYTDCDIEKILSRNFIRVANEVWK